MTTRQRNIFLNLHRGCLFISSFVLISSLFSLECLAGDLYVSTTGKDTNSGTVSAPLKTILKASNLAGPGTIVHVAPGVYQGGFTITASGSALAHIRYISDVKWGAKIVPVAGPDTIWKQDGGYTDIEGFEVDGTGGSSTRQGIYLTGGNSSVKNSWIHHVALNSGCDADGGAGLLADQYRGASFNNYDFIGNVVHDIGGGCLWIQGIYHASSGSIKNNLVYAASYGIHLYHDDHDVNIINNTVFGCSQYGIVYGGCQEAATSKCPTSGIKIYNNIVYDNVGGIAGAGTDEDVNNELKNNLVFKNQTNFDLADPSNSTRSGEVSAEPQFVNYIRKGGGDYHLKSTSPAIDAGSSNYVTSTDIDGNPRLQGAKYDMGAFEYAKATPIPTPISTPTSDTILPVTSITSPLSNTRASAGSQVIVKASASDNIGTTAVDFYVNGAFYYRASVAPYQCNLTMSNRSGKTYKLQSKAYDKAGNMGISQIVTIRSR